MNNAARTSAADYGRRDDAALLAAASRRDQQAFAEIVSRYHKAVYRVVWRMMNGHADSEDIAQEAFLKLWRDPSQVRDAGALKGWLMRVASNAVVDRSRRPVHGGIDDAVDLSDPAAKADGPLDRAQAARLVDASVAALPDRQRLALTLVYFEGMTNIDVAAVMEVSVEAVESLLSRAKRGIKERLAGSWGDLLEGLTTQGS